MPKNTTKPNFKHTSSLYDDIEGEFIAKSKKPKKIKNEPKDSKVIEPKLSFKILSLASHQLKNDADDSASDSEYSNFEDEANVDASGYVNVEINEDAQEKEFFPAEEYTNVENLGSVILKKLKEKEASKANEVIKEDQRIVEMFQSVGVYLSKYRSGRIPKAFKIIPTLSNWEEMLVLTDPLNWTPGAMFQAVRIFASNLKPEMAQKFYMLVLLPAIREDIKQNKRLHFQYYQALKKAMFKVSAWIQGILLPLLNNNCSLREAVIVASVLSKISIPPLHVAGSLIRLCQLHKNPETWTPATSYMIRTLLDKKVNLTTGVISAVIEHFENFLSDKRVLPVIWHQTLLIFVQRYKLCFSAKHIQRISKVIRAHSHHLITPEIKRELDHAKSMCWMQQDDIPKPKDTKMITA